MQEKLENIVYVHSNVSLKHLNYFDIVPESNVVRYEISCHYIY